MSTTFGVWLCSSAISQPSFGFGIRNQWKLNPRVTPLRASLSDIPLASKIMVRNLSYSTTESLLRKEFSNFGQIAEVKLLMDKAVKRSKGYAFIQYTCQDEAMLALESMDYKEFDGRVIFVELAKPGRNSFASSPRTSGPPQERNDVNEDKIKE